MKSADIKRFNFNGNQVRTVMIKNEPWFVAKDVCDVLEIANSRDATSKLDDDDRHVVKTDTSTGPKESTVISESGLYCLIMRSNKPQARQFQKWVTREVLPTLRKTGVYVVGQEQTDDPFLQSLIAAQTSLAATTAIYKKQLEAERELAALNQRMTTLEVRQDAEDAAKEATEELIFSPPPTDGSPEMTPRALINRRLRQHVWEMGFASQPEMYESCWKRLYLEIRDCLHIDLKVRAKNLGIKPLEVLSKLPEAEQNGCYAISCRLFPLKADGKALTTKRLQA